MRKKLLVVGSNTIHTYNFIDLVKEYFDEVLLLTNTIREDTPYEVVELDFRLRSFQTIKKIKKIAHTFEPTHIHVHQANSYAFLTFMALRNSHAQKVLNAWGSDILLNPKKGFFFRQMVKFSLKQSDIVVADSDTVLYEAKLLVPDIKTKNINFGIKFLECSEKKENIIYSNRLHKSLYNIDKIIFSFQKFVKQHPEWKLVIAGSGDNTGSLQVLIDDLGLVDKVEFVGFLDNKTNFAYYCKSKIYVSIPSSDSISLSLVEAVVSGCIPFVSNLSANRELVENNRNGFIEDNLEDIDFSKYMQIETEHFKKTRERLKVTFSKEYNKKCYFEIYDEVYND